MSSVHRITQQNNWLYDLVRNPRKASHPLRHILLIHFLGKSLNDFFGSSPDYRPFGQGPWPCLNPVADHYHEQVISNCTVGLNCETKAPTGTFACECGFVYKGRDQADSKKMPAEMFLVERVMPVRLPR